MDVLGHQRTQAFDQRYEQTVFPPVESENKLTHNIRENVLERYSDALRGILKNT